MEGQCRAQGKGSPWMAASASQSNIILLISVFIIDSDC